MKSALQLITEHAEEYYDEPRYYAFTEYGFVLYEVREDNVMYINDIFISKDNRTGSSLKKLIKLVQEIGRNNSIEYGFVRVSIANKHYKLLTKLYKLFGFKWYHTDVDDFKYYKWRRSDGNREI